MKKLISALTITIILLQLSCATISSPSGGPEDETPPKLITSIPAQGQTNYTNQTILLTFDERVATQNIETDIIITPRITGSFKTRVKKNIVEITFYDTLVENTTYALAFGKTIKDITNNNPAQNLNISFSTGDYIDSLTISGNIKTLLNQEPSEGALVALYQSSDSTNILNGIASYFTITDSLGNYKFNNLPSNSYRLYATKDKNQNNRADSQSEKYGFYPDTLTLNRNLSDINMTIQNLNTTELRKLSSRHFANYFDLTFNKSIIDFEVLSLGEYYYQEQGSDKIRFYRFNQNYNDTIPLIYSATDSLNTILQDTVGLYFVDSDLDRTKFSISTVPDQPKISPETTLKFQFSKPVMSYNLDSIQIEIDSVNTIRLDETQFSFNKYQTELSTGLDLSRLITDKNPQITLSLKKSSFISVDNDSSEVLNKIYSLASQSETAIIEGRVNTNSEFIIVQLINANNRKVIKETYSKEYRFEYLPAGRYMIRVIDDKNNNRKLDIGNILDNEPPENVHYYFDTYFNSKVIEVRKNWQSTANISF